MSQRLLFFSTTVLLFSAAAFAQTITADSPFQVRYASNLNIGDSVVNITNSGAFGNLCINVYTFDPEEEEVSCCTCTVTPNALTSLSVKNSLISDTLTGVTPTAVVIKLLASVGGTCNAGAPIPADGVYPSGMAAWGTTLHALPVTPGSPAGTYSVTETAFAPSSLSTAELLRITSLCGFIQTNGSSFGICKGCSAGGLGATVAQ